MLSDEYKRPWTFSASSGAFLWDDPDQNHCFKITRIMQDKQLNIFSEWIRWFIWCLMIREWFQVIPMERTLANLWILCFDVILHSAMRLGNRRMLFFHLRILSCKNKSMFWSICLSADETNNKHFRLNPYFNDTKITLSPGTTLQVIKWTN